MTSSERLRLKVRLARQGLNLTQQEVSQKISVSLRTYQRLESGQTPLDVATLYQFCEGLDLNFLELTSPELGPEDCECCEFFKTEKEFLAQPKINSDDILLVKKTLSPLLEKNPHGIFQEGKHLETFYQVKSPLLLSDPQTTIANPPLNNFCQHYNESKWKTASKFKEPLMLINALDIALKHSFAGFKVINSVDNSLIVDKYYLLLSSTPHNPITLGLVV